MGIRGLSHYSRIFEKDFPCIGRVFRITGVSPSDFDVSFKVEASEVVRGCEDHQISLVKVSDNSLEGQLSSGGNIRLTRK